MTEPTMFGPYRLLELIGRGGMGEVWRADDVRRGRTVALKRLGPRFADSDEFRERFRREARAAARVDSPHVVVIHDFGEIDGRLFIDMRLVPGTDLAGALARQPDGLGSARAATLTLQIAGALDAAHRHELLHRDVKPSNVLLESDRAGERAYLSDFGIVKAADEVRAAGLTAPGDVLGTPAYMAPELFDGPASPGVASDVYALGCVLYEMLTGQRPFRSDSTTGYLGQHLNRPVPLPSAVHPGLAAFDPVVARALAKDPAERYAGAGALGDDAFAAARTAAAQPTASGPAARSAAGPAAGPGAGPAAAAGSDADAVPGSDAAAGPGDGPPPGTVDGAEPAGGPDPAGEPGRGTWWRRRRVPVAVAAVVVAAGVVAAAVLLPGDADPPGVAPPAAPEQVAGAFGGPVGVLVSEDGRRVYVADSELDTVTVLDAATRATVATVPAGQGPNGIALAPDGRSLYVADTGTDDEPGSTVTVIDTGTNTVTRTIPVGTGPLGVTAVPDGRVYVAETGTSERPGTAVSVIDPDAGAVVATIPVGPGPYWPASSPDGRRVYVPLHGSPDRAGDEVAVIDTATGAVTRLPAGERGPNWAVPMADGNRVVVSGSGEDGPGSVQTIDVAAGAVRPLVPGGIDTPEAMALGPDGRTLVVAAVGRNDRPARTVSIVDADTGAVRRTFSVGGRPLGIAIAPDGSQAWVTTGRSSGLWRVPLS